jgi:hypothetical protein
LLLHYWILFDRLRTIVQPKRVQTHGFRAFEVGCWGEACL